MATLDLLVPQSLRSHGVTAEEWQLRLELAALYAWWRLKAGRR